MKKLRFLLLLCIVILLFTGTYSCKKKTDNKAEPINLQSPSVIDSMIIVYSKMIKKDSENDDLYFNRAKLYERKRNFMLALKDMEKAVEIEKGIFNYYNFLGDLYFNVTNIKAALGAYEQSIKLNPTDDYAVVKSAKIYLYRNEPLIAIGFLNKAVEINKYNPETYAAKALYYLQLKDTNRAISNLRTSVEVDPDYFNSYVDLGYLLSIKKDKTAIFYFDNALRIEPDNIQVLYNRGKFYQDLDSFNKAINDYELILSISPSHKSANFNLGYIYYLKEEYIQSIKFFTEAIKTYPEYKEAFYGRGLCYSKLNDKEKAKENFNQVLKIDPQDIGAQKELDKLK